MHRHMPDIKAIGRTIISIFGTFMQRKRELVRRTNDLI